MRVGEWESAVEGSDGLADLGFVYNKLFFIWLVLSDIISVYSHIVPFTTYNTKTHLLVRIVSKFFNY